MNKFARRFPSSFPRERKIIGTSSDLAQAHAYEPIGVVVWFGLVRFDSVQKQKPNAAARRESIKKSQTQILLMGFGSNQLPKLNQNFEEK
jgi:hypothetical protein